MSRRTRFIKAPLAQTLLPHDNSRPSGPSQRFFFGPYNERCAIPREVIREIMLLSMQGEQGLLDHSKPPLLFCRVSPGWLQIASSTQDLWTTIAVTEPYFTRQNLDLVRTWLSRSGPTKLLRVTLSPSVNHPDWRLIYAFQTLFLASSHRWSYLGLSIPAALLPFMLGNPYVSLQALEGLALALPSQPNIVLSPTATRLRDVSLTILPERMALNPFLLNLNWQHIRHVDVITPSGTIEMVWALLEGCPNLCGLTIQATNNMKCPYIPYDLNRRLCVNLKHLTMRVNTRPGALEYFFDALFLPQLRLLDLECVPNGVIQEDTQWPLEALMRLYNVALPPLTNFILRGKVVHELDLMRLVNRIKPLRHLDVRDQRFSYVTASVRDLLALKAANAAQRFAEWQNERQALGLW